MKKAMVLIVGVVLVAASCTSNDVVHSEVATTHQSTTTSEQTTSTIASTTSTSVSVTSTTTITTTTTTQPTRQLDVDVIVYGDSVGAVGAAVAAARQGRSVAMVTQLGYLGGQASASAISTMDEYPTYFNRESGLYGELYDQLLDEYGETIVTTCYYSSVSFCPEPLRVRQVFDEWVQESGVVLVEGHVPVEVRSVDGLVTGLLLENEAGELLEITSDVLVAASETGELYPLVEGLEYSVGNGVCAQKTTWSVVRNWYANGSPAELVPDVDTEARMRAYYGDEIVEGWLKVFRRSVSLDGYQEFPGWSDYDRSIAWSPQVEKGYRGMADGRDLPDDRPRITRSGLNNNPVDQPISAQALAEPGSEQFISEFTTAKDRSYLYLWYEYYELGVVEWGIATDQEYSEYDQMLWSPNIPDAYERHMPIMPYFREHPRIEGVGRMTWDQIYSERGDMFDDSVLVGGYMTDQHGCAGAEIPLKEDESLSDYFSGYGAYDVDSTVFIPKRVDGFLPGILSGASVDRLVAGSLRMQPTELLGGQVAGTIAAIASERGVQPRDVDATTLRERLLDQGVIIDVPESS